MSAVHYYRTTGRNKPLPPFQITLSTPDEEFRSVVWSPKLEIFVTVGLSVGAYSVDGVNWVSIIVPAQSWYSVCWSEELEIFVAAGISGNPRIMTSSDGINWTLRSTPINLGWYSVVWSPKLGLFCAGRGNTSSGTIPFITSPNGITWTSRSISAGITHRSAGLVWNSNLELFVSCGGGSGQGTEANLMTSEDGINWIGHKITNFNGSRTGLNYVDETGIMYTSGVNTNVVSFSTDAFNWGIVDGINPYMHNAYVYYPPQDKTVCAARPRTPSSEPPVLAVQYSKDGVTFKDTKRSSLLGKNYGAAYSPKFERIVFVGRDGIVANNI